MGRRPAPSARELAAEVLTRVETDDAYSHVVLDVVLHDSDAPANERRLATRIVYGTLAWQRRIDAQLEVAVGGPLAERTEPFVRAVLRSAVFQLQFLDRVPTHAAVDAAVELVKARRGRGGAGFVNAVLRRVARGEAVPPTPEDPVERFALEHSLPDDLARRALARFASDEAAAWARAINAAPPLTLRVNRSRASLSEVTTALDATPARWAPAGLHVSHLDEEVRETLRSGLCAVQDEGSQLVVHLAEPLPPGEVWDACAGQGGKTAHLLDLVRADGLNVRITASDQYASKLKRLIRTLAVLDPEHGVATEVLDVADGAALAAFAGRFQTVLVDAPCTGFGLVRRHPETRWRRGQLNIEQLAVVQRKILDAVAATVAPGGCLIYAVCTDTLEETDHQVDAFLERHGEFVGEGPPEGSATAALVDDHGRLRLWPHVHGTDGFFAARLRRVAGPT